MAGLEQRTVLALAAAAGLAVFLLTFALGWTTETGGTPQPRAELLASKPTAVAVLRLTDAPPLPELRPAPRARQRARPRTRPASRPTTRTTAAPQRRRAPRPVTIVGTG
jgi:hypothetical protein